MIKELLSLSGSGPPTWRFSARFLRQSGKSRFCSEAPCPACLCGSDGHDPKLPGQASCFPSFLGTRPWRCRGHHKAGMEVTPLAACHGPPDAASHLFPWMTVQQQEGRGTGEHLPAVEQGKSLALVSALFPRSCPLDYFSALLSHPCSLSPSVTSSLEVFLPKLCGLCLLALQY